LPPFEKGNSEWLCFPGFRVQIIGEQKIEETPSQYSHYHYPQHGTLKACLTSPMFLPQKDVGICGHIYLVLVSKEDNNIQ
jgi:hypothetical protein